MKTLRIIGLILGVALCGLPARAQVATVTGNLKDLGVQNATQQNTYVQFYLKNFGSNIPRVVGTNAIVSAVSPQFKPDSNGNISGNIQENNSITPANTFYRVCVFNRGVQFECNNYLINGNFDLNTAVALDILPLPPVNPQKANTVYAGPASGSPVAPKFRALVGADLPFPGASAIGGVFTVDCSTVPGHIQKILPTGVPTCSPDSGGGGGAGNPGAPNNSLQYNNGGSFAGAAGITTPDGNNLYIKGPAPWIDATTYGMKARTSFLTTNATTTASSGAVNLAAAQDFVNGDGIVIWKAGNATTQSTPGAPTVTSPAVQGSRTINYKCVGTDSLGGLTAASAAGTVTNAPTSMGDQPIQITSMTQTSGTVAVVLSAPMPRLAPGLQVSIVNESGANTLSGVFPVATSSDSQHFTYSLAGNAGSIAIGTYGAWARLSNTYNITAITRSGTTITITTNANHGFQVQTGGLNAYSRTIAVVQGVDQSPEGPTNDMNGEYVIVSASGNSMTLDTALSKTETGNLTGYNLLFQPTVTVYEYVNVACPSISAGSQTVAYYVYADYANNGTFNLIGKTLPGYPGQSTFIDYGPWQGGAYTSLFESPNGYVAPAYVPTTAPAAAQRQMYVGAISSGGGTTTLSVTPVVPASTTQTAMHDEGFALNAALSAAQVLHGATIYLPPSDGSYIFNSPLQVPLSGSYAYDIKIGSPLIINETISAGAYTTFSYSLGGSQFFATSFQRSAGVPIYGLASPQINSTVGSLTLRDLYFNGTSSASQTSVYVASQGAYGLTIERSTFLGGGDSIGTSVPLVIGGLGGITGEIVIRDSEFAGYFNGLGNGWFEGGSTINIGPNIPTIWVRGNDDGTGMPQIKLEGENTFAGRGILFDGTYGQAIDGASVNFLEYQSPLTPTVMLYGTAQFSDPSVTISNGNNDSQPGAIVGNWSAGAQMVVLDHVVTSGAQNFVTGSKIHGLIIKNVNLSLINEIGQNSEVQRYLPGITDFGGGRVDETATEDKISGPVSIAGPSNYQIGVQLQPPTNFTASVSGVGTIPAGTYPFKVQSVGWNGGESAAVPQEIEVTVNGSQGVATSWTAVPFAKGYNVYLSGQRQNASLITSTSFTVTALAHNGAESTIDGTGVSMMDQDGVIAPKFTCPEGSAPGGVAGATIFYCDSTSHLPTVNPSNAGAQFLVRFTGSVTSGNCQLWSGTTGILVDAAGKCAVYTITPVNTHCVTWVVSGGVTSLGDSGSACGAGGGGGMDPNMDNMTSPTAMNTGLTCVTVNTCFVGTQAIPMTQVAIGTVANQAGTFDTSALTTNRSLKWPDAATVLPQAATATTHQFFTALSGTTGAFTKAQPTLADIAAGASPAGLFNFAASTMRVPEGASFTASATSTIGLDITANALHGLINSADAILGGFASAPAGSKCLQSSGAKGLMAEAAAACGTWTDTSTKAAQNLTASQEGTGNVITTVGDAWQRLAGCNNTTAGPSADIGTTGQPTPNCLTGTNVQKATLDFDDGVNEFVQFDTRLPHTWVGNIDVNIVWLVTLGGGSNAVKWTIQTACSADGASFDPAFNTAQTVTTNVAANGIQTVSQQNSITTTGCNVDNILNFKIGRDTTDTFTGTARMIGVQYVVRHTGK